MVEFTLFTYPVLIREHHLDTFGHVNNAVYLQLLEEARWEFLNAHGFTLNSIHKTGISPVLLECHLTFLKEITLRQNIIITSQMQSYEKKIGIMHQNIQNEQGELLSKASITFGFFDMKSRKLILPPKAWLQAIGLE